jgi:hypothetical protein
MTSPCLERETRATRRPESPRLHRAVQLSVGTGPSES